MSWIAWIGATVVKAVNEKFQVVAFLTRKKQAKHLLS